MIYTYTDFVGILGLTNSDDQFTAGTATGIIDAKRGNDVLNFTSVVSVLYAGGGLGNDQFNVGASLYGISTFAGDGGNDSFTFNGLVTALSYTLFDGGDGIDTFEGTFSQQVTVTRTATERLAMVANTGLIDVKSVTEVTLTGSDFNDTLRGLDQNDTLNGGAGDDYLRGYAGNDVLNGGTGADEMVGNGGDDTYYVDDAGDVVTEAVDQGTDLVHTTVDNYVLAANVENLIIDGTDSLDVYGNELDNKITGNSADNRIDGGLGADKMLGGDGSDTYTVDNGKDSVEENAGEGIDTVYSSVTFDLGANVENLTLTGKDKIFGSGNGLDNVINGNDNVNKLNGGAGNDTISGGAGWDRLIGGLGRDTLTGGAGGDWFVYKNVYDYSDEGTDNIDRITDFNQAQGDRIDVVNIDGNSTKGGYQRFDFIGTDAFSGKAGELRYEVDTNLTRVMFDTNGDGQSDLTIELDGVHTVTMGYFMI